MDTHSNMRRSDGNNRELLNKANLFKGMYKFHKRGFRPIDALLEHVLG